MQKSPPAKQAPTTEIYEHKDATVALRPDVGTQGQFKQKKPTQRYRYDSSLSPALEWDGQNAAREQGEALIAQILTLADKIKAANSDAERNAATSALQEAARQLKALGKPFLDWAGKAERLSFDVPTLPLFVHERLSTEAIIQTLRGHRRGGVVQPSLFDLFADPQRSIADQVLKAYEYRDQWTNRMILGDSLVVMNSLLHYEGLGGQVQMIYMAPPYEISGIEPILNGKRYQLTSLLSDGQTSSPQNFSLEGKLYRPRIGSHWKTSVEGLSRLVEEQRIEVMGTVLRYRRFVDDFPVVPISDRWESTQVGVGLVYVVQTSAQVIQRRMLMTTDPGDLVLDPTCGSGTTAYVAEQWRRRWITADVSRVPLALARQRLLTATFSWYDLKDEERGPAGGFVYQRKQNKKGEEVGGIVPHVTLKSIANNEPPTEEVLVDRPERNNKVTRVTGPFTFEAMIPSAADLNAEPSPAMSAAIGGGRDESNRMLEVLRRSPVMRLDGNRTVTLYNLRPPARSLVLSAEALVGQAGKPDLRGEGKPVAFVFGPENAAISEKLVKQAAFEAQAKSYTHLFVIGFAIQPHARQLVDQCEAIMDIPATYVQATPDLLMGDLLKNMRSSQIFSVCGFPAMQSLMRL